MYTESKTCFSFCFVFSLSTTGIYTSRMSHMISSNYYWKIFKKNASEFICFFSNISLCMQMREKWFTANKLKRAQFGSFHKSNWIESIRIEFEARFIATGCFVSMDCESCLFDNNLLPNCKEMQPALFSSLRFRKWIASYSISHFQSRWLHPNIQFESECSLACMQISMDVNEYRCDFVHNLG